jgi:hypothetical protein
MKATSFKPNRPVTPYLCAQAAIIFIAVLLTACSSTPPSPAWSVAAADALARAQQATLRGDERIASAELERAGREVRATAQLDVLARLELAHCAAKVATLEVSGCPGFEALRADANAADTAYARWLYAPQSITAADAQLLLASQRGTAMAIASRQPATAAVQAVAEPLARLVACSAALRGGSTSPSPALLGLCIDTASHQGWRLALAAWLQVGIRTTADDAQRAAWQRRLDVLAR